MHDRAAARAILRARASLRTRGERQGARGASRRPACRASKTFTIAPARSDRRNRRSPHSPRDERMHGATLPSCPRAAMLGQRVHEGPNAFPGNLGYDWSHRRPGSSSAGARAVERHVMMTTPRARSTTASLSLTALAEISAPRRMAAAVTRGFEQPSTRNATVRHHGVERQACARLSCQPKSARARILGRDSPKRGM